VEHVRISKIFASIVHWHQQAFWEAQGMQAQVADLREADPLTQIATLRPMMHCFFVAICKAAIFSKL